MTGKPDFANGKGSPGIAKLFVDGKLVGQIDVPVTTPLILGLTGGVTCGLLIDHQSHQNTVPPLSSQAKSVT